MNETTHGRAPSPPHETSRFASDLVGLARLAPSSTFRARCVSRVVELQVIEALAVAAGIGVVFAALPG